MPLLRLHAFPRTCLTSNAALRIPARSRRRYATAAEVNAKDLTFGQPVYETHKHILQPGESTKPLV
jgi:hypothetical protein